MLKFMDQSIAWAFTVIIRDSPGYRLIHKLEHMGATVSYNDPHVPSIRPNREFPQYAGRCSQDISPNYDLIMVATHHDEYKKEDFSEYQIPLVDTRNCIELRPKKYYQA